MLFASFVEVTHRALATVDLVIIGVYFAIVFGIGMYFSMKERTSEDYFLAGRDIGWFFIGASLFVSNISTEHFIGLSGTGASSGLAVGHFEWLACLILLILGWVFVPFYLRSNVFTMPEFLERRFNRQCAVYLAGISIIAYIFTKISVQLYAASVVLERVAGWSLWKTAVVLVIATGIYRLLGTRVHGFEHAKARQIFRRFLDTNAKVDVSTDGGTRIPVSSPSTSSACLGADRWHWARPKSRTSWGPPPGRPWRRPSRRTPASPGAASRAGRSRGHRRRA